MITELALSTCSTVQLHMQHQLHRDQSEVKQIRNDLCLFYDFYLNENRGFTKMHYINQHIAAMASVQLNTVTSPNISTAFWDLKGKRSMMIHFPTLTCIRIVQLQTTRWDQNLQFPYICLLNPRGALLSHYCPLRYKVVL